MKPHLQRWGPHIIPQGWPLDSGILIPHVLSYTFDLSESSIILLAWYVEFKAAIQVPLRGGGEFYAVGGT